MRLFHDRIFIYSNAQNRSPGAHSVNGNGMPIPWFFQQESATAFEKFEIAEDDVVLATVPYGGATWVFFFL